MTNFANRYIALVNELASIDDPLIRGRQTTELLQTIKKMGPFVTDMRKRSIKELSDAGATFDEIGDMLGGLTKARISQISKE